MIQGPSEVRPNSAQSPLKNRRGEIAVRLGYDRLGRLKALADELEIEPQELLRRLVDGATLRPDPASGPSEVRPNSAQSPLGGTIGGYNSEERQEEQVGEEAPKKKPRKPKVSSPELDGFAEWYEHFPRHDGRKRAAEKFASLQAAGKLPPQPELLAATDRYAATVEGNDAKFIAMPETWLNQERFHDQGRAPAPKPEQRKLFDPQVARERIWAKADKAKAAGVLSPDRWGEIMKASDELPDREAATALYQAIPEVPAA